MPDSGCWMLLDAFSAYQRQAEVRPKARFNEADRLLAKSRFDRLSKNRPDFSTASKTGQKIKEHLFLNAGIRFWVDQSAARRESHWYGFWWEKKGKR